MKKGLFLIGLIVWAVFFIDFHESAALLSQPERITVQKALSKAKKPLFVFVPDLLTVPGDLQRFFQTVRESGAWGIRFFALYSWGKGSTLTPYIQIGFWKHPTTGKTFPFFDLSKWNSAYFARFRAVLDLLKKYELEAVVSIHDLRLKNKNERYYHPFYCSVQAMAGRSAWGVYGEALKPYHKDLARKIIEILKASGAMFRIEPANEFSDLGWAKRGHPDIPKKWYIWFVQDIMAEGVPGDRLIHSGWKEAVFNQPGVFSAHGIVRVESASAGVPPPKILLSGDGGYDGDGAADAAGRRGLSAEEAKALAGFILVKDYYGYEFMDRGIWKKDTADGDLSDFDPTVLKKF